MNVRNWFDEAYTSDRMAERKKIMPGDLTVADELAHAGCATCHGRCTCLECDGRGRWQEECAKCSGIGHCPCCGAGCEDCFERGMFDTTCEVCNGSGLCPELAAVEMERPDAGQGTSGQ